jgi:hypothetical protein
LHGLIAVRSRLPIRLDTAHCEGRLHTPFQLIAEVFQGRCNAPEIAGAYRRRLLDWRARIAPMEKENRRPVIWESEVINETAAGAPDKVSVVEKERAVTFRGSWPSDKLPPQFNF